MNKKIYTTLWKRIVYLEYEPGRMLKENEIAKEFGVSQTPLKTILTRLELESLIRIFPRAGIQVIELELNALNKVYQARGELESVIGSLAAQNFTDQHFTRLDLFVSEFDRYLDNKEPRQLVDLDIRIKQFFGDTADNPYLSKTAHQLYALTLRLWYYNLLKSNTEEWKKEVSAMKQDLISLSVKIKNGSPLKVGNERKRQLIAHIERLRSQFLKFTDVLYH